MQKSYIAKSPINFVEFNFRVNSGDVLVHELASHRLTVYRAGEIVKTLQQTSLGMAALIKNGFIYEQTIPAPPAPAVIDMLKRSLPKLKPDLKPEPKKEAIKPTKEELEQKRKKAVPTVIEGEENFPPRLKEALALKDQESKRPPLKVEIPEPIVDKTV